MRTNIEIDDQLMAEALAAGPFKTKKEAVEAGLVLLKRQAAMRELLKMGGTVSWGWGDEERLDGKPNWQFVEPGPAPVPVPLPVGAAAAAARVMRVAEPSSTYRVAPQASMAPPPEAPKRVKSRARR